MIMNLEKQLKVIETGLASDPNKLNLLRNQMEVENKLELARFELNDMVEVKTELSDGISASASSCMSPSFWTTSSKSCVGSSVRCASKRRFKACARRAAALLPQLCPYRRIT